MTGSFVNTCSLTQHLFNLSLSFSRSHSHGVTVPIPQWQVRHNLCISLSLVATPLICALMSRLHLGKMSGARQRYQWAERLEGIHNLWNHGGGESPLYWWCNNPTLMMSSLSNSIWVEEEFSASVKVNRWQTFWQSCHAGIGKCVCNYVSHQWSTSSANDTP